MVIRKGELRDASSIVDVIQVSVLSTHKELYSKEAIEDILSNYTLGRVEHFIEAYDYFVAEENNEIVGCVLMKEGKMRSLYILPLLRGQGLGRKLVEVVEDCAREQGYKEIWLWSSLVSYDFYIHMGYEFIENVKNDKDIIVDKAMKKSLK